MATNKFKQIVDIEIKGAEVLNHVTKQFDKMEGASESLRTSANLMNAKFHSFVTNLQSQLASGKLNVGKLGLSGVLKDLDRLINLSEKELNAPISEEYAKLTKELQAINKEMEKLNSAHGQKQAKKLGSLEAQVTGAATDAKAKGLVNMGMFTKGEKIDFTSINERIENFKKKAEEGGRGSSVAKKRVEELQNLKKVLTDLYDNVYKDIQKTEKEHLHRIEELNKGQKDLQERMAQTPSASHPLVNSLLSIKEGALEANTGITEIVNSKKLDDLAKETEKVAKASKEMQEENKKEEKSWGKKMITTFSYYTVFNQLKKLYREMIRTIRDLDLAMTDIVVVTTMNRKESWALLGTFQDIAKEVGITTSEVAKLSTEFFKQGRNLKDTLELTRVAAKSAKVASIDVNEAVDYLTSAINGFGLAADAAEDIASKFSLLSAASATDFEELAIAMSKVSPVAQSAGVGLDFMMGILAKGLETTREAPENIGTAFKTIFARMRELTDIGKATEDGMSLNRVEKALDSVGITLRDNVTGGFRDLDGVLMELGRKWKDLNSLQQAYLATALAGTRQQPRLLAIMNDFERTEELINMSAESTRDLEYQHMAYMEGMEASMTNLATAWEGVITSITNSDLIIGVIDSMTVAIEALTPIVEFLGDNFAIIASVIGTLLLPRIALMIASTYKIIATSLINIKTKMIEIGATKSLITALRGENLERTKEISGKYASAKASLAAAKAKTSEAAATQALAKSGQLIPPVTVSGTKAITGMLIPLGKLLLIAGAVAAVGYTLYKAYQGIAEAFEGATVKIERFSKKIKENSRELYNNTQKQKELTSIVDEYEKLNKTVQKTNEELEKTNSLLDQLQNYDGELNFTKTIGGVAQFDDVKYNEYLQDLEKKNEQLTRQSQRYLITALSADFELASANHEVLNAFEQLGFSYAEGIINGIEDADIRSSVNQSIAKNIGEFQASSFQTDSLGVAVKSYLNWWDRMWDHARQETATITGDTVEEIARDVANQFSGTAFTAFGMNFNNNESADNIYRRIMEEQTELGGNFAAGIIKNVDTIDKELLNTAVEFQTNMIKSLYGALDALEKGSTGVSAESIEKRLEAYNKELNKINRNTTLGEDIKISLRASLEATDQEGKALRELIVNRKIEVDVVAQLYAKGLNANEIDSLFGGVDSYFEDKIKQTAKATGGRGIVEYASLMRGKSDASKESLEKFIVDPIASNLPALRKSLGNELYNVVYPSLLDAFTKSATALSSDFSNIFESAGLYNSLAEEMQKGNMESFSRLSGEFGVENTVGFMKGQKGISDILKERAELWKEEAQANIDYLKQSSDYYEESGASMREEVAQLEFMIKYNENLNMIFLERNFILEKTEKIQNDIAKALGALDNLENNGFKNDFGFVDILNDFANAAREIEKINIENNLVSWMGEYSEILEELEEQEMKDADGNISFTPGVDDLQLWEKYNSLVSQGVDIADQLNEAYEREYKIQEKSINKLYDEKIEKIKEINSEKWKEIKYENQLQGIQDKIVAARSKLVGSMLDGSSRASVDAAKKALRDVQLERQEMIENETLAKVEKQLEADRENTLIKVQEELNKNLIDLTAAINRSKTATEENTEVIESAPRPTGGGGRTGGKTGLSASLALALAE